MSADTFRSPDRAPRRWRAPRLKDILREVVVLSAFLASAGHIYHVAVTMGNSEPISAVHAVGVDGLVYIGIGAFRDGAKVRGGLAVLYGGAVSLAFNYAAYSKAGTLPAWIIAASMPIVLVLAVLVSMSGAPTAKRIPAPPSPRRTAQDARQQRPPAANQAPVVQPPAALPAALPPHGGARRGRRSNPVMELAVKRVLAGEPAAQVAKELNLGARNVQIAVKKARAMTTRSDVGRDGISDREIPPTDAPVPKGGDVS
jgi:hypothetical protein